MPQLWLAADYHFPSTYSIKTPMSSMNSALALPAPGPATVRLALVRTGIELFGIPLMREEVFPWLRSAAIRIQPPEKVAISEQLIRGYKWARDPLQKRMIIQEALMLREMAHAAGYLTVFMQIDQQEEQRCRTLLQGVGYWGQSSSLACCIGIRTCAPVAGEYAVPLTSIKTHLPLQSFFASLVSEFREPSVSWDEVVAPSPSAKKSVLQLDVYVWPLQRVYAHQSNILLIRQSLLEKEAKMVYTEKRE